MCLGVIGRVVEINDNIAKIDVNGVMIEADASFIQVQIGDYVVVHAGLIISKVREEEANLEQGLRNKLMDLIDEEFSEY